MENGVNLLLQDILNRLDRIENKLSKLSNNTNNNITKNGTKFLTKGRIFGGLVVVLSASLWSWMLYIITIMGDKLVHLEKILNVLK